MYVDPLGYDASMPLYLPQPVSARHPLNRGRSAWWLTVPALFGGNKWYDLCDLNPGTLTGMTTTTTGFRGISRPGGYGSLRQVGNPNRILLSSMVTLTGTFAAWFNPASTVQMIQSGSFFGYTGSALDGLYFASTTSFQIRSSSGAAWTFTVPTMAANTWYRLVVTYNGHLYLNGVESSTGVLGVGGTIRFDTLMAGNSLGTTCFNGWYDDISYWNRSLSAAEVKADYGLSQLGYPGVLNRFNIDPQNIVTFPPPYFSMVSNVIPVRKP